MESNPGTVRADLETGLGFCLLARGAAARALRRLLAARGSAAAVLELSPAEAAALAGEPVEVVAPLLAPERAPGLAGQLRRAAACGARTILLTDPEYPPLLRETADPPPVLVARGRELGAGPAVAVVGSRRATRAGLEAARVLAGGLARAGVTVVSGFARGIDAAAHAAALDAGGTTWAVLGCGADVCYPAGQAALLDRVLGSGTVLSEWPLGTEPLPFHFPVRNRIIAGLSRMAVVVEAAERSGSLITARCAAEAGRDVGAVPGPVASPVSAGTNALLKDGAILVRDAADVLAELPGEDRSRLGLAGTAGVRPAAPRAGAAPEGLDPDAAAVWSALDPREERDADLLAEASGLPADRLSAALVLLELRGLAEALPGALFVRRAAGA